MTEGPIELWDRLLAQDDGARDSERLRQWLFDREMSVPVEGGSARPLVTVLRPHLIERELYERQARAAELVISAIRKVRDAIVADPGPHLRHFARFREWIGDLAELDASSAGDGAVMRLDASITSEGLHFIELNADTPQGVGHNDRAVEFFQQLDTFRAFGERYRAQPLVLEHDMLGAIVDTWRGWAGGGERPTIATVSIREDPVRWTGLEIDAAYRRRQGYEALVCEPEELEYSAGRLRCQGKEVDVLQRVLLAAECVAHRDRLGPLLDAVREDAVCMVNAFSSELLGHKAIFALLTDPGQEFGFSSAEQEAIAEHVPWTRIVVDGAATGPKGAEIDLLEFIVANRERLVLKPTHDAGGHGVHLGWEEDEAEWRRSLAEAQQADFIAQLRVPLRQATYPTLEGASAGYYEDTDPFLFRGGAGGMLVRLSATEITNVHQAGGVVASFVVEPR